MDQQVDLNILKSLTTNRKHALEFIQEGSEHLFHPEFWRFTRLLIDYIKVYKDVPSPRIILERLQTSKNEVLFTNAEKIFKRLQDHQFNEVEYKPELEKLKVRYQEQLIHNLKGSLENATSLEASINSLQKTLTSVKNVSTTRIYGQASLKEGLDNFIERFKARKANPEIDRGIQTGFTQLDTLNNGFKAPELVIVAGNTGAGKSSYMLSLGVGIYLQNNSIMDEKYQSPGKSVLFFSLEMPIEECQDRLISYLSGVPLRAIKSTQLTEEQETKLNKTIKFIKNYKYDFEIIDIPKGATAFQIESIYNEYCERRGKVEVVIVDYLNIMNLDTKDIDNDWLAQAEISEQLYKIARVNNLVLITGVQLNETGKPEKTSNDTNIGTHRIGRSKAILHPATMALMLEKRASEEAFPTMNVYVIKNRRGPLGKFSIRKNLECCGFTNDSGFGGDVETTVTGDLSAAMRNYGLI